jgi:dedicator of cytokinesis protein 3
MPLWPRAPVPMLKIGDETPTSSSKLFVDESTSWLREWHSTNLHELLPARRYSVLDKLSKPIQRLDLAPRQELDLLRERKGGKNGSSSVVR